VSRTTRRNRLHGKNDFVEGSKIWRSENNFVGTLKIMSNAAKNFNILAIVFYIIYIILHNYLDSSIKLFL